MLRLSHVFALMLAATAVARAQPDKRAQALQLAADSEREYKAAHFEKAAELLRKAHGIYAEPILLYNLGRALEGMGDAKGAVEAYEEYLHDAKQIDDRPAIERRVATLKAQIEKAEKDKAETDAAKDQAEKDRLAKEQADKDRLAKEQADKDQAAREQAEREAREKAERAAREKQQQQLPPPPPPPPNDEPGALHRYGPWVTLGAGGAMIVTGALFGAKANSNHDAAVTAMTGSDTADLNDSAHADATAANVFFVVGGAALVGGAIWEYIQWHRDLGAGLGRTQPAEPGAMRVKLAPTGVALEWTLP
jgi:tetratricopeptide (TPR) repeat protein